MPVLHSTSLTVDQHACNLHGPLPTNLAVAHQELEFRVNRMSITTGIIAFVLGVSGCNSERATGTTPLDPKSEPRGTTVPVTRIALAIGDSVKLIPVDRVASARGIAWESSMDAVVRVSATGWAFGVAGGTAAITAKARLTTQRWIVDVR